MINYKNTNSITVISAIHERVLQRAIVENSSTTSPTSLSLAAVAVLDVE
jgi:hypothetical protein